MMLTVTDSGEKAIVQALRAYLKTLYCHLYVNDYVPQPDDDGDEYILASFPGYSPILLDAWGPPVTRADGFAETVDVVRTWTRTEGGAAQVVYGYNVRDNFGNLIWAERRPGGPITVAGPGAQVQILARFTLRTQ